MDFPVVPRILFENWQVSDLKAFFTEPSSHTEQKALIEEIKKACKQWLFDGVVLEIMSQIGKYVDRSVKFIQQFGKFVGILNLPSTILRPHSGTILSQSLSLKKSKIILKAPD